ncbi:hypothetical protein AWENTII_008845 [Aspergillus wentii]
MIFQERNNLSNSRALQFASLLAPPRHNQNDGEETALSRFKSYLIDDPNDATSSVIMTSPDILHTDSLDMSTLLNLFVFLSTNNVLYPSQVDKGLSWIIENIDLSTITRFSQVKSLTMKIFLSKLFLSAVSSRNQQIAGALIRTGVDANTVDTSWVHESSTALGIAVLNGDIQMVHLLCESGADLVLRRHDIENFSSHLSLWHSDKLDILHLILASGANPEAFITNEGRGFPLISAASKGSLEAVHLLLRAGANVNNVLLEHGGSALQAAATQGHHEVVLALIFAGAEVNVDATSGWRWSYQSTEQFDPDPIITELLAEYRQTPLQLAAKANDTSLVKILLRYGANVAFCPASAYYILHSVEECLMKNAMRSTDPYRLHGKRSEATFATALQYAAQNQSIELVSLLLFHGAYTDSRVAPDYGDTPLQTAAKQGNLLIASILLEYGSDVNASAAKFNGRTAIQAAAECGHLELCDMLIKSGADVNAPAGWSEGLTAMQSALLRGHIHVVRFLYAAGADINAAPAPVAGLTAVQAASVNGDIDILKKVLGMGAQANAPAGQILGRTALEAAVFHKSIPLLEVLLLEGSDVNARSLFGCTALQSAVMIGWFDGIEYLLRSKADPNISLYCSAEDCYSEHLTALGWCVYGGEFSNDHNEMEECYPILALLLANGADPNLPTSCDEYAPPSALIQAIESSSSRQFITMLLNAGAAVDTLWGDESALVTAALRADTNIETFHLMLEETAKLPWDFYIDQVSKAWQVIDVDQERVTELVDILLRAGADINRQDRNQGETLLQKTLEGRDSVTTKFLLDKGADIDVPSTNDIGTPLQEAIKNKLTEIVPILLERNPDINAPPARKRGVTALQAAALTGQMQIAKELLERGADVAAPAAEEDGRTAIDGAAEHGRLDMLQLLLNAYGDRENLSLICHNAAKFAEKENHMLIAEWLRGYRHS